MSAEKVVTKRKAAEKDARPSKKVKPVEKVKPSEDVKPSKKIKPSEESDKLKTAAEAKKSRKRASDFIAEEEAVPEKPTKAKKVRIAAQVEEVVPKSISQAKSKSKRVEKKKAGKENKEEEAVVLAEDDIAEEGSSDDDEDVAALLAGFSSDDEQEDENEGIPLDQIPEAKIDKNAKKALAEAKKNGDDTPGTLYLGRIPHGFYEHQMRAYFSQFGDITKLRLSRNKRTGASKHYAFVEFASGEVADIVARTMNNYLMFGHILKVRRIPEEQVHPDLWKNEGKRFKRIPWARIEAGRLRQPRGREYWREKETREKEKREAKEAVLKEYGYDFKMPELKSVDDVPMKDVPADDKADEEPQKTITETPAVVDEEVQAEVEKVLKKAPAKKKEKVKAKVALKV